ncbi:hypothetical protein SeLEV6574_g03971 [Synchytrium endobioticum]|uniref:Uncharacterized protein n=1 Tax=Synchytrium endobioticum TaxID=286115 RepID=A0A507D1G3_9FUNG|nr:hypothetical protein SeLEV6574_g03971 [Synchytrium endobioticum]
MHSKIRCRVNPRTIKYASKIEFVQFKSRFDIKQVQNVQTFPIYTVNPCQLENVWDGVDEFRRSENTDGTKFLYMEAICKSLPPRKDY